MGSSLSGFAGLLTLMSLLGLGQAASISFAASRFGTSVVQSTHGPQAFVTNYGSNSVSIIDLTSNVVVGTVTTGANPGDVAASRTLHRAYVVNDGGNDVSVIDTVTDTIVTTIAVGRFPYSIAIDPSGTTAFVGQLYGTGHIYVLDLTTNSVRAVINLPVNDIPSGMAFDPKRQLAYVGDNYHDNLLVIDTNTE